MAYYHHHHQAPPPASAPPCNCCCPSFQTHHHHLSAQAQPDPLLVDAVVSRLLYLHSYQTHQSYQQDRPLGKTLDFSSLVDRIEALEASLHRFSVSAGSAVSVRDAAASVIQRRFRAFLARRSRILRQLQDLAVVKSRYVALRSSVSSSSHVRFERVSRKVKDLLLHLGSIEDDEPMISEGKRSIGRNLDRFLRYVDERSDEVLRSRSNSGRTVSNGRKDNVRLREQREMVNYLRGRVERIQKISRALEKEGQGGDMDLEELDDFSDIEETNGGVSVPGGVRTLRNGGKKSVKFADNGNAYKVISNSDDQDSTEEEDDSCNDSIDVSEKFKKVEVKESPKDKEEGQGDSVGSFSDGSGSEIRGGHCDRNTRYVFTPPVPEKMESIADSVMKKKKKQEVKL